VIKASEAKKQQQINEAEGAAAAILAIASATADGTRRVAEAINLPGGFEAVQLRVADHYIEKFGQLANASDTTLIVPASVGDISGMLATAMNVIRRQGGNGGNGGAQTGPATEPTRPSPFTRPG
jgi:regulator of protease activity HflC (stomatin/prohibitin superfamily)